MTRIARPITAACALAVLSLSTVGYLTADPFATLLTIPLAITGVACLPAASRPRR